MERTKSWGDGQNSVACLSNHGQGQSLAAFHRWPKLRRRRSSPVEPRSDSCTTDVSSLCRKLLQSPWVHDLVEHRGWKVRSFITEMRTFHWHVKHGKTARGDKKVFGIKDDKDVFFRCFFLISHLKNAQVETFAKATAATCGTCSLQVDQVCESVSPVPPQKTGPFTWDSWEYRQFWISHDDPMYSLDAGQKHLAFVRFNLMTFFWHRRELTILPLDGHLFACGFWTVSSWISHARTLSKHGKVMKVVMTCHDMSWPIYPCDVDIPNDWDPAFLSYCS